MNRVWGVWGLMIVLSAGCASGAFQRPPATPIRGQSIDQVALDDQACYAEAEHPWTGGRIAATVIGSALTFGLAALPLLTAGQSQEAIYGQCMEARGYETPGGLQRGNQ